MTPRRPLLTAEGVRRGVPGIGNALQWVGGWEIEDEPTPERFAQARAILEALMPDQRLASEEPPIGRESGSRMRRTGQRGWKSTWSSSP